MMWAVRAYREVSAKVLVKIAEGGREVEVGRVLASAGPRAGGAGGVEGGEFCCLFGDGIGADGLGKTLPATTAKLERAKAAVEYVESR